MARVYGVFFFFFTVQDSYCALQISLQLCDFVLDGGTDAGGDSQEYNHIIEN